MLQRIETKAHFVESGNNYTDFNGRQFSAFAKNEAEFSDPKKT